MRAGCATVVLTALLAAMPATAAEPIRIEAETAVAAALDELRRHGARIVYSSALVPASLRVARSVTGDDALAVARAILAPHGLELRSLGSGVYGVVASRSAERGLLTGRVLDAGDGRAISGARVEALDSGYIGWSAGNGAFTLRMRDRSRSALRVSADGYRAQVVAPQGTQADGAAVIRLESAPLDLEQVTVVASRFTYGDPIAASAFVLDQADIVAQPTVGEDALQSIARLPGVVFSGVSARPNVRGGEKTETLVVLDRMPLREAFHLPSYNSAFSVIDEALIARLDAYTGPQPARYGNRLAAVIELESVDATSGPSSVIGISTFNARARTAKRQRDERKPAWLAAGRVGTVRAWLDDYAPDVGRPTYGDLFAKLGRSHEDGVAWQLSGLWSGSELEFFDPDTSERAELTSRAAYLWLTTDRPLGDHASLRGLLGYSHIDSDRHGTLAGGLTPQGALADTRASRIVDASLQFAWQPTGRHTIGAGLAATAGRARYHYTSEVEFDPIAGALFGVPESREHTGDLDLRRSSLSAFLSDRVQLSRNWFLEAGLRIDHDLEGPGRRRSYFSPRLAARWNAGPATVWRMSYGRAQQATKCRSCASRMVSSPSMMRSARTSSSSLSIGVLPRAACCASKVSTGGYAIRARATKTSSTPCASCRSCRPTGSRCHPLPHGFAVSKRPPSGNSGSGQSGVRTRGPKLSMQSTGGRSRAIGISGTRSRCRLPGDAARGSPRRSAAGIAAGRRRRS